MFILSERKQDTTFMKTKNKRRGKKKRKKACNRAELMGMKILIGVLEDPVEETSQEIELNARNVKCKRKKKIKTN